MGSTLTPVTTAEPVAVPGRISGNAIINDLCNRIADKLAGDCSLRQIDSYSAYSTRVLIEIQLVDIYPTEVVATVAVGKINPQLPALQISLGSDMTAEVTESGSLERPIDSDGVRSAPVKGPRYYTPRGAKPLSIRAPK